MKKTLLLFLSLLVFCAASAQVTTSGMNGKVTDNNGEPLVGATIIAIHTPSGTQYGAVASKDGRYNMQGMRAGGPYTVTFTFVGYQGVEQSQLTLQLGETLMQNASLKDSHQLEAVVISADGAKSAMNVNRAGAVTSISSEQIDLMPSVNRSMNDIMRLTPQASSTTSGLAIGGGNYRQSYVTVDGAAFNNAFGIGGNLPSGGTPISLDALEQISVSVTPFDVRQSGFTGGAINAVTKAGTNDFKVAAYNYYKSDALQGRKYDGGEFPLTKMKNDVLGVSIGAPIIKDKLFVFGNFEYEWNTTPSTGGIAREKEEGMDFGGSTPYNRPTVAKMNTIRNHLISQYGYDPGEYQNYSIKTPGWKVIARVDWNINTNNSLNVRFSNTKNKVSKIPSNSFSPLVNEPENNQGTYNRTDYGRTSPTGMFFQNSRYYEEQNFMAVAAELNSRFLDGRMNNMLRATFSRQYEPRSYDGGLFPTVDILEGYKASETADAVPAVYASFGTEFFTQGNLRDVNTYVVTDELGYTFGAHRIIAGLQFEHNKVKNGYMQGGAGYYLYETWDDFVNEKTPLAFRIAHPNNNTLDQEYPSFTYMQFSAYLQDEINISERLKATVGVRFEVPVYPSLSNNENKEFTKLFAGNGGYKTSDMPKAHLSVSPRFGFNWDMTGERKYILRGGTGLFTGRLPFVWIVSVAGNSNCSQSGITYYRDFVTKDGIKDKDLMPGFHTNPNDILNDLYGGAYTQQELPAQDYNTTILDQNLKMPSTWKSSLALDLKLPGDIGLNLEGIYSKDINAVAVTKLGMREKTGGVQLPGEPTVRKSWETQGIKNSLGKNVTPYLIHNSDLAGYYYSLTAQLSKRFRFGLSVLASYTYSESKNVIDGIGDQVTSTYNTNTFNYNGSNTQQLGYASYITPHRILLSVNYRKEYGRHFASNVGLYYEVYQQGYIGNYSYSRYSYTMGNVTGDGGADNLLYVPTREQLDGMPFASEENKEAYWSFINHDKYLSTRIGKQTERGGAVMPWVHTLNFKYAQDFFVNVKGKRNTITVGIDINNLTNLLNKNWGEMKQMDVNRVLNYKDAKYTFTQPKWGTLSRSISTWSAMFSVRYTFN